MRKAARTALCDVVETLPVVTITDRAGDCSRKARTCVVSVIGTMVGVNVVTTGDVSARLSWM